MIEVSVSIHAKACEYCKYCNVHVLGPRPNTCFARDGKELSSGTLVIRTQTFTLTRGW